MTLCNFPDDSLHSCGSERPLGSSLIGILVCMSHRAVPLSTVPDSLLSTLSSVPLATLSVDCVGVWWWAPLDVLASLVPPGLGT